MEKKYFEFRGMEIDPRMLWDVLFYSSVKMQIEFDAYGTDEERRRWLIERKDLAQELMYRLPFEGNGVVENFSD